MPDIANGSLVKHASLGIGKVVALEATAVHVFFPQAEKRYAAKLRWPAAKALLTAEGVEPDAWLTGLTSFALDAKTGRYALAANFLSHTDAIAEFLEAFPRGFDDPAYLVDGGGKPERAARWRAASAEWTRTLGDGEGERLLSSGGLREVVGRALRVNRQAACLPRALVEKALDPGDAAEAFFGALFRLLSAPAPGRPRAEELFGATHALGVGPTLAWPMATLFPFLADPTRHVLMLPRSACGAAARLGCNLRYEPAPNWATYNALRDLSTKLLVELRPHGARDLIDVEAFLHTVGTPPTRRKT
jgi:hypothetical protein